MTNFTFKKIDAPGPAGTYAYVSADGVDLAGEAVGNFGNVDGDGDGTFHGFTAQAGGSFNTFDPPNSTNTNVEGITSSGEIFGTYTDNLNRQYGFVDNGGVVTQINEFLANSTTIDGVNDGGVIYGEFADSANSVHGFVDNGGTFGQLDVPGALSTAISGVNASGVIVGTYTDAQFKAHGFVESGGSFKTIDPSGSIFTSVVGVSDAGVIVGNYQDSANNQHSFIDTNGVITTISIPGATGTGISAINAAGEIVGYYSDSVGNIHGFIDENGAIITVDVPGATQTDILGVSATGVISGYYNDSSDTQHGFVGTLGTTVIESSGSTSLTEVGFNYYFYDSSQSEPSFKYGGTPFVDGEFGAWTLIGAEQVAGGGYDVALKVAGADQYTVWSTDSNGNYVSSLTGVVSGTSVALETLESVFHQDLNGDGSIGLVATVIESSGSTSLDEVGNNFYFLNSSQSGPSFKFGGTPFVAGEFGAWTLIGAEQVAGGYDVALKVAGADQYTVWNTDSNGNYVSAFFGTVSGSSISLESFELIFHQDLNGDGTIGPPTTVIESFGSTTLAEVGTNFYFYDSSQSGPSFKFGGTPFVAGEFGAWTLIGAEQVAGGGYDVALKVAGADQYTVWSTDSNGNYVSALIGTVSGSSTSLELFEPIFQQDLNGDGNIGPTKTIIESSGSTSLDEIGNNFYFYNSSQTGPEFTFGNAPFFTGELGAWTPIGAEKVAGGYDVALKVAGADQYTIWNTDNNGIYVSSLTGTVSGNSSSLESFESIFHQDLNGDGTIGVVTTVIEAAGSTTLEEVGNNYYFLSGGPIPSFKLDGTPIAAGQLGPWAPIGVEEISTPVNDTYDVVLKVVGADQYTVWSTDSDGNYISALTGVVSGTSATLESYEPILQQDLNGDGSIGIVTTVIEAAGVTALTEVANNFYFYSGGVGPEFKFNGTPYVAGEFGAWTLIGAEQVSGGGYDLTLKVAGADQYTVWSTDSNGNYVSAFFGTVSGASTALESMESAFHQDLNGDGVIGTSATVASGATLELKAADSVSVQFNGPTGTLILDHSAGFTGQISNLTGTGTLSSSDQIDLKDIAFNAATTTVSYSGTSAGGTLTVSDAQNHTANIALAGNYTGSTFTLSSDGSGGTTVIDPPVKQDLASGTLSFSDADSTGMHTVSVTPENGGQDYVGNFVADAVTAANGQDSVGWHFNFDSPVVAKTVTQPYDVTVTDHHADGTNSAITQPVTVTIAGPGNDGFVFHPGGGADLIVNAASSNTIELDGFSSVTSNSQLASLLAEAQAGQPQSVFQSENGGHDTLINLGNHDSITLTNVHLADLHASNFIVH
jgi:20S proteasome alpha/beta subunit